MYIKPEKVEDQAKVFKAFCDPNRLRILELLTDGEKCSCYLEQHIPVSQPTLSHHLKILTESGLVKGRKDGKWVRFSLNQEAAVCAAALLKQYTTETVTTDCTDNRSDTGCEIN